MQKTFYISSIISLIFLVIFLSSCNNKANKPKNSRDLNEIQGKIEKDYFNALSLKKEYDKNGQSRDLQDKIQANIILVSSHVKSLKKFDYESQSGLIMIEIIYHISSVYNEIEFLETKNLRPLKKALKSLHQKNDKQIKDLSKIITLFE